MIALAAVDKNWAIGNRGGLLVQIPEDQKLFRQETLGKVLVMGRKTLQSLPGGRPLYGRRTLVLTRDRSFHCSGAEIYHDLDSLLAKLRTLPSDRIYICGGESVYRQFLPYLDSADITMIDYCYQADRHFPDLDGDPAWQLTQESEEKTYFDLCYTFRHYEKTAPASPV